MRVTRIILLALVALALAAGCNEQKQPAPEAQKQAQKAPEQTIEAAKPATETTKPAEVKPAKVKPAEVKPTEAKPAEAKPAEAKPAEAKPAEVKPAEVKPTDAKADPSRKPATVAATEPYVLPELEKVVLPEFNYPKFTGKKMSIVFTGNVVGELEPGG